MSRYWMAFSILLCGEILLTWDSQVPLFRCVVGGVLLGIAISMAREAGRDGE